MEQPSASWPSVLRQPLVLTLASAFLDMDGVGALDMAMTSRAHRSYWLHNVLPEFCTEQLVDRRYCKLLLQWVAARRLPVVAVTWARQDFPSFAGLKFPTLLALELPVGRVDGAFWDVVQACPALQRVSFGPATKLSSAGLAALAARCGPTLTRLQIYGDHDGFTLDDLLDAVAQCPRLAVLDVYDDGITRLWATREAYARLVPWGPLMATLTFDADVMELAGFPELLAACPNLQTFTHTSGDADNAEEDVGNAPPLLTCLAAGCCPALRVLCTVGGHVPAALITDLGAACPRLGYLHLHGCAPFGEAEARALGALRTSLRKLDLEPGCSLGGDTVLRTVWASVPGLTHVTINEVCRGTTCCTAAALAGLPAGVRSLDVKWFSDEEGGEEDEDERAYGEALARCAQLTHVCVRWARDSSGVCLRGLGDTALDAWLREECAANPLADVTVDGARASAATVLRLAEKCPALECVRVVRPYEDCDRYPLFVDRDDMDAFTDSVDGRVRVAVVGKYL